MSYKVPTLSRAGWADSVEEKVDYLVSDFFCAEASQSYLFDGSIASLTRLIQYHQGDISGLIDGVRNTLQTYLRAYFEDVIIDVSSNANTAANPTSSVELRIYCQVVENGKQYSIGHLLSTSGDKISKIIKFNNEGIEP